MMFARRCVLLAVRRLLLDVCGLHVLFADCCMVFVGCC